MSDLICEVCWTSSWQPCEEGTKDAVRDNMTGGWMVCAHCALEETINEQEEISNRQRERFIKGLAVIYNKGLEHAVVVAEVCDMQLDRSGALLGEVREIARQLREQS